MNNSDETIRLNKHLALQLGVSRREADELIEKHRVTINGKQAELGARITHSDNVLVDNKAVGSHRKLSYIAFNKPVGYVCSRRAQGESPTIYSLLPKELHHLKPVGRLDKDSSGLILLTNDGDFAHTMTHPSFVKQKIYRVRLDRELEPLHQQMISDFGIQLDDGASKLSLERLNDDERFSWQVIMSEGRNRQIRRTFAALGYTVTKLHRIQFGPYQIGSLKRGNFTTIERR